MIEWTLEQQIDNLIPEVGRYRLELRKLLDIRQSSTESAITGTRRMLEDILGQVMQDEELIADRELINNIEILGGTEGKLIARRRRDLHGPILPPILPKRLYSGLHTLRTLGNTATHPHPPGGMELKKEYLTERDFSSAVNLTLGLLEWYLQEYERGPKMETIYAVLPERKGAEDLPRLFGEHSARDVFISYSHKDQSVADAVCARLEENGIRCWIAPRDLFGSQDWKGGIIRGIRSTQAMVLILSAHSNVSKQVFTEVNCAFDDEKIIIPFLIENVSLSESLVYSLSGRQWLDALTPPLQNHIARLVQTVKSLIHPPTVSDQPGVFIASHTDAVTQLPPAPTPESVPADSPIGEVSPVKPVSMQAAPTTSTMSHLEGNKTDRQVAPHQKLPVVASFPKPQQIAAIPDVKPTKANSVITRSRKRISKSTLVSNILMFFASTLYVIAHVPILSSSPFVVGIREDVQREKTLLFGKYHPKRVFPFIWIESEKQLSVDKQAAANTALVALWASPNGFANQDKVKAMTVNAVQQALDAGADVNTRSKVGSTALAVVSEAGRKDIAQLLIDHHADINIMNVLNYTPLMMAATNDRYDIAQLLINHGARIDVHGGVVNTTSSVTTIPLLRLPDESTALMMAASNGHADIVQLFLDHKADVNARNLYGNTALIDVATKGYSDIAQQLLDRKADVNAANTWGSTALMEAAYNGHADIVQLLLDYKADVNAKNTSGWTALAEASYSGYTVIAQHLINYKADVNTEDASGNTALMRAAVNGHENIARFLIDHKANVNAKSQDGSTALMLAATGGQYDVANLLINHHADVRSENARGDTALMLAAASGHENIAQLLIDNKADVNAKDGSGSTALIRAVFGGHVEIVSLLLSHENNVNQRDIFGKTALSYAESSMSSTSPDDKAKMFAVLKHAGATE